MLIDVILLMLFRAGYSEFQDFYYDSIFKVLYAHKDQLLVDSEEIIDTLFELEDYLIFEEEKQNLKMIH